MSASSPSQTVFSIGYDFHWQNGDNGNVINIYNYRDRNRDQAFAYDPLNRLISAQNAGTVCTRQTANNLLAYWGNTYTYDPWGNLTNKTKIPTACSGETLSAAPALLNNQLPGYGYDPAGNMTYDTTPGHQITYTYDQENRIAGIAGYAYTYDADGNRVKKATTPPPGTPATGTLYWYMTPGIVAESDLNGNTQSEYIFFNGERVARRDFGPTGPTGVFYYFSDHLKTASVITDAAGTIKAESDYYPWGGELQFVANDSNHYKFTGKERDTETGLDYFGARYYSNGLGRWVSADWSATPIPVPYADFGDPQSLNLYSYVRNIPTTKYDVDGHQDCGYFCRIKQDLSSFFGANDKFEKQIALNRLVHHVFGGEQLPASNQLQNANTPSSPPEIPTGLMHALGTGQQEEQESRSEAFSNAKRDANIPTSSQPDQTKLVPLTDSDGKVVINETTGKPVMTREYTYTNSDGQTVVIQDHSRGHQFDDGGTVGPHFNVRPPDDTRHGTVPGTKPHYPYKPPAPKPKPEPQH